MKKLTYILTLLVLTMVFSLPSYSKWTSVAQNTNGSTFYVDFERIRKHGGYVYWWDLVDYLKPKESGTWSSQTYYEGDCGRFRTRILGDVYHKQSMGRDVGRSVTRENPKWVYPSPGTISEHILTIVCNQ